MASTPTLGPSRRRGSYRKYLRDASLPVPRQTLWRQQKKASVDSTPPGTGTITCGLSSQQPSPFQSPPCSGIPSPSDSLSHSRTPSPSNSLPHSRTPSPSDSLPHSHTPSPSESLPHSHTPSPSDSLPHSCTPSPSDSLPHSRTPSPSDSLPHSRTPSPSDSLPHSHTPSPPDSLPCTGTSNSPPPGFQSADSDPNLCQPLYSGARITVCGAMCAIMQFSLRHKLSYTAVTALLQLLLLLLPTPNCLPASFYKMKKFFHGFDSIISHQKVCGTCQLNDCSCSVPSTLASGHLVELSIEKPIQTILTNHWDTLQLVTDRPRSSALRDIWDGSVMQKLRAPGRFFSSSFNLALSLCTDGVEIFKSSPVGVWPVYLVILNLPARIRMKAENIIFCGLWVGPGKPPMPRLLEPIMRTLRSLKTLGIQIKTPAGLSTIRAKLVMGIFDLPAKASALCVKQYNGTYGCTVCEHPGRRLSNRANVYLPNTYPMRTHTSVLSAAKEAERKGSPVLGVKGLSPLSFTLDLVASIPVDYMHAVLEGATKWLTNAWFQSENHRQPYYLGRYVTQIDNFLLQQRPPQEFSQPPRSIRKHIKFWKASEFRSWLLYYSLPILLNYLPSLYWHHYALLVCAIHILLKDSISHASLEAAECMLADFHNLLPELYGECSCTANAHLLTHLTKYVRLWGPLWTHSTFGFENKNGQLKYLFHGKSDIVHQLLFNINVGYTLQLMYPKLASYESQDVMQFIYQTHAPRSNMILIGQNTYAVGQTSVVIPNGEQASALGTLTHHRVQTFSRLYKDGTLYYSLHYSRASCNKRDNTICCFRSSHDSPVMFGRIELFVLSPTPSILLRQLQPVEQSLLQQAGHPCRPQLTIYQQVDLLNSYIVPVVIPTSSTPLISVSLDQCVLSKAVIVSVSDKHYVISQPNNFEYH